MPASSSPWTCALVFSAIVLFPTAFMGCAAPTEDVGEGGEAVTLGGAIVSMIPNGRYTPSRRETCGQSGVAIITSSWGTQHAKITWPDNKGEDEGDLDIVGDGTIGKVAPSGAAPDGTKRCGFSIRAEAKDIIVIGSSCRKSDPCEWVRRGDATSP